jgi:hypothetical protein
MGISKQIGWGTESNILYEILKELKRLKTLVSGGSTPPGPGTSFNYAKTLFVDINGDNLTALEGRMDYPWRDVSKALDYISNNSLADYTIWVFPGNYQESNVWNINIRNTTIKLQGGVTINFTTVVGNPPELIVIEANCSIIGDDRAISSGQTGVSIYYAGVNTVLQGIKIIGNSIVKLSNLKINLNLLNAIELRDYQSNLHITNCYIYSMKANIYTINIISPKIAVTNSILVAGILGIGVPPSNITAVDNSSSSRDFNGYWNFENVRFVLYYDATEDLTKACHILSRARGEEPAMYVTLSNCKFYGETFSDIAIWHDTDTLSSGINYLEIVGTSLSNGDPIYSTSGTLIGYLGDTNFILTRRNIADPTIIEL